MISIVVEQTLNETRAVLGEGPVWHEGKLHWVDIEGCRLLTHAPSNTHHDDETAVPDRVGFAVPRADSKQWICGQPDGLYFVDRDSGVIERAVSIEADQPRTRFNDGKTDPQGRLWAGTMDMEEGDPLGSLYQIDADLSPTARHHGVTVSNGLAWAPDGQTLYYIDSPTREVLAFDFDPASGAISNPRTAVRIAEGEGFPDGMAIDSEGMLWIALWGGWRIVRHDPADGRRLAEIRVPAAKVTSCAFGGADLDELYITTARIGLTDAELGEQPGAGGLFKASPGVQGAAVMPFGGDLPRTRR